jgi:hypothetical protein
MATGNAALADIYDQWMAVPPSRLPAVLVDNPKSAFNVVSVHFYQDANNPHTYFRDAQHSYDPPGLLHLAKSIADADGRPLWLGEFGSLAGMNGQNGAGGTDGTAAGEKRYYNAMLDALVTNQVPLSAVWNYGPIIPNQKDIFDIQVGTGREYQMQALADANARLQA